MNDYKKSNFQQKYDTIHLIWQWPWMYAKTHWAMPFCSITNINYHNIKHLSPVQKIYDSKGLYFIDRRSVKGLYFDKNWVRIIYTVGLYGYLGTLITVSFRTDRVHSILGKHQLRILFLEQVHHIHEFCHYLGFTALEINSNEMAIFWKSVLIEPNLTEMNLKFSNKYEEDGKIFRIT